MSEGFKGLTPNELLAWRPPMHPYIISRDILLTQGTMGIYGAEATCKSILAMDLMFKVATGRDWLGLKTIPTPTYYFQSEMPQQSLQKRAMKYVLGNQINTNNCWLATDLYEKIDKGWGAGLMAHELARTHPGLLMIDPIFASVAAKLVDDYEIGLVTDQLNRWRKEYRCAVVIIHHSRQEEHSEGQTFHYGTQEWFGSTRWLRWLDTIIFVELLNEGERLIDLKLTFEKTRHAESKILPLNVVVDRDTFQVRLKGGA